MTLREWCRRLVEFKFSLDDKIKAQKITSKNRGEADVRAILPFRFVENSIPFWTLENAQDSKISFVDPNLVIGATYKRFEEATAEKCRRINDDNFNLAEYEKIGTLPLYVAIEGKNRVRLFQKHQIKIKARVTQLSFPSPGELQLHQSWQTDDYFLSCSNDFYVQQENRQMILLYPEITVPLFNSYGVKEGIAVKHIFPIKRKRLQLQKEMKKLICRN